MKVSSEKRILSIFLIVTFILSSIGYASTEEISSGEEDPFACMVELAPAEETPAMVSAEAISADADTADEVLEYSQRVQAHYEAQRKTDRYIVKYKSNSAKLQFTKSLGNTLQSTSAVQSTDTVQSTVQGTAQGTVQDGANNFELLILDEAKEPADFANQLRNMRLQDTIEYIQPDFLLHPDSVELEFVEAGSEETESGDTFNTQDTPEVNEETNNSEQPAASGAEPAPEPEPGNGNMPGEPNPDSESAGENNGEQTEGEPESEEEATPENQPDSEEELTPEGETEEPLAPEEEPVLEESEPAGPVIVAVIDTGADVSHEMIADSLWTEYDERVEEEINGWNFVDQNEKIYDSDNPIAYAHGTHISGVISQSAANSETPIKLMNLKVFENGSAYTSDVIAAIEYAREKGAKIINCSFGGTQYNRALYDTIAVTDALFVCAAGNNRMDLNETPVYPACFDLDNIVSVASINADGGFSYFSNYSVNLVDITALGRDVLSALPENRSDTYSGTSMATAAVSGSAAAVLGTDAELSVAELRERLLNSADQLSNLQNKVASGRRLNPDKAIANQGGEYIALTPEDDFDVHGFRSSAEDMQLFSNATPQKIAAGAMHSLILMNDGSVWAFGNGYNGSLGDGNASPHVVPYTNPVRVIGLPDDVLYIYAGGYHNLAVTYSGHVYSWGDNTFGQLGRASSGNAVAMQVAGLSDIVNASVGESHSLATYSYTDFAEMQTYTYTYFWGDNSQGQLGMPGSTTVTYPQNYITMANGTRLYGTGGYAGKDYTIITAITQPGGYPALYYGSGNNAKGQLCNGTTTNAQRFVRSNATDIRAAGGQHAGYTKNVVNVAFGDVYVWGSNSHGQTGGSVGTNKTSAQLLYQATSYADAASSLHLGENHTIIRLSNGSLLGYGRNDFKQLGFGNLTATSVAAGYNHNLAISNGTLWVWGANTNKQIENNTTSAYDPVEVTPGVPVEISLSTNIASTVLEYSSITGEITGTAASSPVDLTSAAWEVQSGNPSIAQASVAIENGKAMLTVEGQRQGQTSIEIQASANGISGTLTVPIQVLENTSAVLVVSTSIPNSISQGQNATAEILLTINGMEMDLTESGTVVTALSSAPLIAGATVETIDNKLMLKVTGNSIGEAMVNISVNFRGKNQVIVVPITVTSNELTWAGVDVTYDFSTRPPFVNGDNLTQLTNYNMTLSNNNLVRNPNWKYLTSYYRKPGREAVNYYGSTTLDGNVANGWVAFIIQAETAGKYMASLEYTYHSGALSADMYLLSGSDILSQPGDLTETINQALSETEPTASFEYLQFNALEVYTQPLGEISIPAAGEYVLILKVKELGEITSRTGASAMTINRLLFKGAGLESVQFVLESDLITQSRPVKTHVRALMNDGALIDLNSAEITYASEDTSIVSIDANGVITAVANGETTVSVTVTVNGASKTVTKPIRCDLTASPSLSYAGAANTTLYDLAGDCDQLGIASSQSIEELTEYGTAEGNYNWAFYGKLNRGVLMNYYGTIRSGTNTNKLSWQAFRIHVPASGRYTAKMSYSRHFGCKSVALYLFPGGTSAERITAELQAGSVQPIGTLQYETDTEVTDQVIGNIFVPFEGDNIFVMKVNELGEDTSGGGIAGLHISDLTLDGEGEEPIGGQQNISRSVEANRYYYVMVKGAGLTSFGDQYAINYDDTMLEVDNMCAFRYPATTGAGVVTGTDIQIIGVQPGQFIFKKNREDIANMKWSGVLNIVKFKAKATGQTEISLSVVPAT